MKETPLQPEPDFAQWHSRLQDPSTRRAAFAEAVEAFSQRLYWLIRRMVISHEDANDLLQNTFLKAWANLDTFRGEARISTWLYKIDTNECLTHLEKQRLRRHLSLDDADSYLVETLRGDEFFDGDAVQTRFQTAILQLPPKQRLVFNLRYYNDMKYEDMSEALGTSEGALKASYHHAVKKITAYMTSGND